MRAKNKNASLAEASYFLFYQASLNKKSQWVVTTHVNNMIRGFLVKLSLLRYLKVKEKESSTWKFDAKPLINMIANWKQILVISFY